MDNSEEYDSDADERWIMVQKLFLAFMSQYTNEPLEELMTKFETWVNDQTKEEVEYILGDGIEVSKTYKNLETKETFYTKEDIIKSMFNDEE